LILTVNLQPQPGPAAVDVIVIGAGQAGLSAAYHLVRLGFAPYDEVVVLDRNDDPGGAWQHRWDSLTMKDVHGIASLPGLPVPSAAGPERANAFVPSYFAGCTWCSPSSRGGCTCAGPSSLRGCRASAHANA
jgi:cation diffusion facilitator CzcD-associated flavoprotein CzcO